MLNFLYRLEEKGWVKRCKTGSRNVYTPTVTRRAYGVFCMRQRLDTLFGGDLTQAVRALVSESGFCMRQRLDTLFGGDLTQAVRALVSESGCSASQLGEAIRLLEQKQAEAEEYELYDPYG